jgi:Protein of unknown function (DUF433)
MQEGFSSHRLRAFAQYGARSRPLALHPDRDEFKREYPELEDEDIRQALAFAASLLDNKVVALPSA